MVWGVHAANHPELQWKTFDGDHFIVHYHTGTEQTAHQVYLIAESVYDPISSVYNFWPAKKIHIIVRDHDDIANGASYTHGNKIEIWATSLHTEYRGTHQWLKNVFTHEFTHAVSRQAALRFPSWLYAFTLQGSESYSNPDIQVTVPYATDVIPQWFSEGIAQYEDDQMGYEAFDTNHDMLLRMAFLDSTEIDYVQMGIFEKGSTGSELVYNQGYSLVAFISDTFGREKVAELIHYSAEHWHFAFDSAIKGVLHISADSLYTLWHTAQTHTYGAVKDRLEKEGLIEGDSLLNRGFSDSYGTWSPDGKKLAVISSSGAYLMYSLFMVDPEAEKYEAGDVTFLQGGMSSQVCWSPDGTKLYYSRMERVKETESYFNDLFCYTLETEEEEQLTEGLRVYNPAISSNEKEMLCVHNTDGAQRIAIVTLATDSIRYLTPRAFGHQYFNPRWSPDGRKIVVCAFTGDDRDILVMNADGSKVTRVVSTAADERDPCWSADGTSIFYVSDITGIFNVYRYTFAESTTVEQLTNVVGGAFSPSISGDTLLCFSTFSGSGFKLNYLDSLRGEPVTLQRKQHLITDQRMVGDPSMEQFLRQSRRYTLTTPVLNFFPNVVWSNKVLKLGCEFYGMDVLGRQVLEGGMALGKDSEMNTELHYELNIFKPTLFADFFYIRRNYPKAGKLEQYVYNATNEFYADIIGADISYRFDLYQTNAGMRYLINSSQIAYLFYSYKDFKYSITLEVPGSFKEQFSSLTYLSGHNLNLIWARGKFAPSPDAYISPRGYQTVVSYALCADATWDTLQEAGTSRLDTTIYNRYDLSHRFAYALPWWGHVADLELSAGLIDKQIHSNFAYNINFLVGGYGSIRSLPFYSLEGNRKLMSRLTYRFPIIRNINKRLLSVDFVRLYGGLFFEAGNAWNGGDFNYTRWKKWAPHFDELKKGAGLELRMDAVSFYSFPMKVYFSVAGLLDELQNHTEEQVYKNDDDQDRIRYYFGVGFNY